MSDLDAMKPNNVMCEGCLATDRKLAKLGKYTELFYKLEPPLEPDVQEPLMCWECRSAFNRISKFHQQVAKAQFFLKAKHEFEPEYKCLSTLNKSSTRIDYYDTEIVHKSKKSKASKYDAFVKLENIDLLVDQQYDIDINFEKCEKNDYDDGPSVFDDNDYTDNNETVKLEVDDDKDLKIQKVKDVQNDNDKLIDTTDAVKTERKRKITKPMHFRYNIVRENVIDKNNLSKLYKTIRVDKKEVLDYLEKERKTKSFYTMKFKCDLCVGRFRNEEALNRHNKKYHSTNDPNRTCNICKKTFPTKSQMQNHFYLHLNKFECLLCGHYEYSRPYIYMHLEKHDKHWECKKCKLRFAPSERHQFHKHYRNMHLSFICDYCEKKFNTRSLIQNHIKNKHTDYFCKECNLTFTRYGNLKKHKMLKHMAPKPSEETYCVECDIQFANIVKYKNHINGSVKHRTPKKKRIECPECGKIYAKNIYMVNHFNLVHLKQTKYVCNECSRFFLNSFRLRQHTESFHSKIQPVKNKLCPYCGRGFSTNHILRNHVRTHTGEKPYSCSYCAASFAQKVALTSHIKKHEKRLV